MEFYVSYFQLILGSIIRSELSYLDCNSCLYYYINRFDIVGYGCMTCIGNSGPLPEPVSEAIEKGECLAYCINLVMMMIDD